MKDELQKQIGEILDKGQQGKGVATVHISVGDIVNNQGTVVIGGNVQREGTTSSEEDSDSEGDPDASALRQELHALHEQLQHLKRVLTTVYRFFLNTRKRPPAAPGGCPNSNGTNRHSRPVVPICTARRFSRPARTATAAKPRHAALPVPLYLPCCHQIPLPTMSHTYCPPSVKHRWWPPFAARGKSPLR